MINNFIKRVTLIFLIFSGVVNAQNNPHILNLKHSKTAVYVEESQDFLAWQNQLLHEMIRDMVAEMDHMIALMNQTIPYPIPRILEDFQVAHFHQNDLILVTYQNEGIAITVTIKYINTFGQLKLFNADWDIRLGISNGV